MTLMRKTSKSKRTKVLATGSLLAVSALLTVTVFSALAGTLQNSGIQSAFAQGNNMTAGGNQTDTNSTAPAGNQSSTQGGDMAQGDPDGDGL